MGNVNVPEGWQEFVADLERSRAKYPRNGRMFDGLMGEVDELRRAYAGDGDIRAEAFDVAVCAYRIATEGDAGGNATLAPPVSAMTDDEIDDLAFAEYETAMAFGISADSFKRAIKKAIAR